MPDTPCHAYVCTKQCQQYVPGPRIGRDTWPSCNNCTHSQAIHKPIHTERKAKR